MTTTGSVSISGSTNTTGTSTITGSLNTTGSVVISGSLFVYTNGNNVIDVNAGYLYDLGGIRSILWNDRILKDAAGANSIDWNNKLLYYDNSTNAIDWSNPNQVIVSGSLNIIGDSTVTLGVPARVATSSSNPITGSMFFNPITNLMYIYNGTTWRSASFA
jgi:hypothetical protein